MIKPAVMLALAGCAAAQLNLMPVPASVRPGDGGRLQISSSFRVEIAGSADERLRSAVERMQVRLSRHTGLPRNPSGEAGLTVRVAGTGNAVQSVDEDESYRLVVDARHAAIDAPNPLGAMHGLETFLQLVENTPAGWSVPAVTIDDRPRFAWRGLHLDVSRHFMPLDVVRHQLDAMAAVKMNVFHWHLSDDQGFRIESKRFPRLQERGSDGLYYTQDEVRGVIAFARDRGIRVVPEFDIPGHSTSWLVGYPELAAAPGPYEIGRHWGIFDPALNPANPALYTFLDSFIGEMASLFPDAYFHIGGDEVNGHQWKANTTDIPRFMAAKGLKTNADLQAYFNSEVLKIVTRYGKRMEGWDEILNPALPRDIVIQSWRGAKSLAEAASQGYQGILSSGYYLDHIEPSSKLYSVDPLGGAADALHPDEQKRILGGEVCMWTEYVSAENVDSRIWPRSAAIAERFWSPANVRDVPDLYRRLDRIDAELDELGLTHNTAYRRMLERLSGSNDIEAVKTLADVLEPGTLGVRHRVNPNYSQQTPLNRLVDTSRPDSSVARRFSMLVDRYLANRSDTATRDEIRRWLALWSANDAKLRPLIAQRSLLADAAPVSALLAKLAAGTASAAEVAAGQKPVGEVTIAVAPAIARLGNFAR